MGKFGSTEKKICDWLDDNGIAYRIRDGHLRIAIGPEWLVYYFGTETFNMDRQKRLGTGLVALAKILGIRPPKFSKVKQVPLITSNGVPVVAVRSMTEEGVRGQDLNGTAERVIDEFDRVLVANGHEPIRQSVPAGELLELKSRICGMMVRG